MYFHNRYYICTFGRPWNQSRNDKQWLKLCEPRNYNEGPELDLPLTTCGPCGAFKPQLIISTLATATDDTNKFNEPSV